MPSIRKIRFREVLLSLVILTMTAGASFAADITVNLTAMETTVTMPGGEIVTVWVFAQDGVLGANPIPGPLVEAQAGDNLTINLTNNLTVPVSLYVNGQIKAMNPVWTAGTTETIAATTSRPAGNFTARVRSFDVETPPSATVPYTWNNIKAGTYMYQSGTDVAAQVPMGLTGVLKVDAVTGTDAYAGISYDEEHVIVFSELDPDLNQSIVDGAYTSSINYHPRYFLINGKPFTDAASSWIPVSAGVNALLRFVNVGLESHVPIVPGIYMTLIAEDGYPFAATRQRSTYALSLDAGKTMDAFITAADGVVTPLYDRRLYLSNNGSAVMGGALVFLGFGPSAAAPCVGDFDFDGDVDGVDAIIYAASYIGVVDPVAFAANFGRTDCPAVP